MIMSPEIKRIGDGRIVIDGETYVNEKSSRVLSVAEFEQLQKHPLVAQENKPNQPTGENKVSEAIKSLIKSNGNIQGSGVFLSNDDLTRVSMTIASCNPTPSSPIDVEQEAKKYADKDLQNSNEVVKELYKDNPAMTEIRRKDIIRIFKAGWEARQGDAVEFAEWCGKEGYSYLTHDDWRDDDYKMFTTEQLYQLFLISKNK